ncbi:MAG: ABC transporter [Bacteroidetes bacterium CG23_combo_of_CG06-09_8_20_14_all_32_9]|nr:MAG: ABC transporter [Bacteroidetes bacterium CG23_combo_of_CG06-09_8_20_14_all_32_9]
MLEIKNISKNYPDFQLKNISFTVEKEDYYVLLGASGTGKSLLLEIISGITAPDSGNIFLDGNDITYKKTQDRKIVLVFNDRVLFPHLTVFDNIAFPLRYRKKRHTEIKEKVTELANLVEIEHLLYRKPGTLSGGESQRVALARVLAAQPKCLLLDEPLSNIDTQLRYDLRGLLRKINRHGQTIIHVTHDYEEAISLANKIAVLEDGKIIQYGTPENIFLYPKSEFIAKFIGVKNFFRGKLLSSDNSHALRLFETSGLEFYVLSAEDEGEGFLLVSAENVIISNAAIESSSRNMFKAKVIDVFPAKMGMEIVTDMGIKMTSIVSHESVKKLDLKKGREIWVSFKASAAKFIKL